MKTAIYIESGVVQLVLTPETEWEQKAIDAVIRNKENINTAIHKGQFYECQGGWYRESAAEQSLIIKVSQTDTIPTKEVY